MVVGPDPKLQHESLSNSVVGASVHHEDAVPDFVAPPRTSLASVCSLETATRVHHWHWHANRSKHGGHLCVATRQVG